MQGTSASDNQITVAQALTYLHQGWSVIPVVLHVEKNGTISKRPAIKWQVYQQRLPTEAEITSWFEKGRYSGIGVVTGQISGIAVVDIEHNATAEDMAGIESPLESQTISGGRHVFYRWTKPIRNAVRLNDRPIDFRGDGGFIVLPPSRIGDRGYSWLKQADPQHLPVLPPHIEGMLTTTPKQAPALSASISQGEQKPNGDTSGFPTAFQGQRNATAAQVAGLLCANILPKLWESVAWPALIQWNIRQCHPPLVVSELRTVWKSITATHQRNRSHQTLDSHGQDKSSKPITILPWKQFCSQEFQEPEWIIKDLIPKQGLVAVAGPPESCKSYFTSYLAITVARGETLFDRFVTKQVPVLVVDQENLPIWIQRRFQQFQTEPELPLHIYANRDFTFNLEDANAFDQVLHYVTAHQIGLLVLDTLRLSHSRDENSSTDMKPVVDRLKRLTQHTAVIFIQHHRKVDRHNRTTIHGEDMMGSMLIRGSVDYQLSIIKLSDVADNVTQIQVSQTKARYTRNLAPFQLMLEESATGLDLVYCDTPPQKVSKLDQARHVIGELLTSSPYKRQEVIDHLVGNGTCSIRTAEAALAALTASGAVTHSPTKPRVYTLGSPNPKFPQTTETHLHTAESPQPECEKSGINISQKDATAKQFELDNPIPHSATPYRSLKFAEHDSQECEKRSTTNIHTAGSHNTNASTKGQRPAPLSHNTLTHNQLNQQIMSLRQWLLAHEKGVIENQSSPALQQFNLRLWQERLGMYCALIDEAQNRRIVREDDWLEMARMIFHANDGTTGKWIRDRVIH